MSSNLYEILGINKNADENEIKKAYRKMAAKFHPDKAPEELKKEYEEKFKKISNAYTILSDPKKKGIYDQCGDASKVDDIIQQEEMFSGFNPFGGGLGGVFAQHFGGSFGGFSGFPQQGVRFNPDITISETLDLEEIFNGKTVKKKIERTILKIVNGSVSNTKESEEIEIVIEKGISAGQKIVYKNMGNKLYQNDSLIKIGNIIIIIQERPHKIFKRSPSQPLHLYMETKISVFQALLGEFDLVIKTLTKENLNINLQDKIIKPGTIIRVKDKGMKLRHNGSEILGDLFIIFEIEYPNKIDENQKQILRNITNYIPTKKKEYNCIYTYTDSEEFNNIMNNNSYYNREDNRDNGDRGERVECATQ